MSAEEYEETRRVQKVFMILFIARIAVGIAVVMFVLGRRQAFRPKQQRTFKLF